MSSKGKKKKDKSYIYLIIIVSLAIAIRLLPVFLLKEPQSTDVWPLIRETNIMLSNNGVRIWDNNALGGYNNRMPGVLLFSEVVSRATGVPAFYIYSFLPSLIIGESMLIFYLLIKRLGGNGLLSISFTFFIGSFIIFTSTLLKEVFAYPLFFLILFLACFAEKAKDLIIIAISSATLAISHPLPTIFLLSTLLLVPALRLGEKYLNGSKDKQIGGKDRLLVATGIIVSASFALYYFFYGAHGVKGYVINSIKPTLFVYASLIVLTYMFFTPKNARRLNTITSSSLIVIGIAVLLLATLGKITMLSNKGYSPSFARSYFTLFYYSSSLQFFLFTYFCKKIYSTK
ncbi:MAG: hypothetical protein LRS41_05665 [Caldisphaeraceae archaeon]|nr:hypothetical protein [Caldisphaeraceae archaeon]